MIDPESGLAVYRQLADLIRDQIQRGELAPGQRLPAEPDYVAEHGISRSSVRQAIAMLRAEGLIVTTRRGSRVRAPRDMALVPLVQDTRINTRMPTEPERRELGLREGVPVFVVERATGDVDLLPGDRTTLVVSSNQGASTPE